MAIDRRHSTGINRAIRARKKDETMRHKHVRMIIRQDGSCVVDAINFTDATCTQAAQQIMQALAGQVAEECLKPEAQRLPPQVNRQREGAR